MPQGHGQHFKPGDALADGMKRQHAPDAFAFERGGVFRQFEGGFYHGVLSSVAATLVA